MSIDPQKPLYEACRRMLSSRARRIPLVARDSQTERPYVVSVITQYRILKFVAINVGETQRLRKPLKEISLGTYDNLITASMETPVIDIIHQLVERSISSVPIVNSEGDTENGDGMHHGLLMIHRYRLQRLRGRRCYHLNQRGCL